MLKFSAAQDREKISMLNISDGQMKLKGKDINEDNAL